jgi:outer membrane protein
MRIKWFGLVAMAATIILTSGPAQGQAVKIGYTDAQLIVAQMDEYRQILGQLQGLADSGQTEYQQLIQSYQEKLADYQKKQALLSDAARTTREQELTTMQGEIQQFLANKEQELQSREEELMNPLLERVQTAINEVAGEQGLTLVINAQAGGSPVLLYADASMDVTELVMDKLGIPKPAPPESE